MSKSSKNVVDASLDPLMLHLELATPMAQINGTDLIGSLAIEYSPFDSILISSYPWIDSLSITEGDKKPNRTKGFFCRWEKESKTKERHRKKEKDSNSIKAKRAKPIRTTRKTPTTQKKKFVCVMCHKMVYVETQAKTFWKTNPIHLCLNISCKIGPKSDIWSLTKMELWFSHWLCFLFGQSRTSEWIDTKWWKADAPACPVVVDTLYNGAIKGDHYWG